MAGGAGVRPRSGTRRGRFWVLALVLLVVAGCANIARMWLSAMRPQPIMTVWTIGFGSGFMLDLLACHRTGHRAFDKILASKDED